MDLFRPYVTLAHKFSDGHVVNQIKINQAGIADDFLGDVTGNHHVAAGDKVDAILIAEMRTSVVVAPGTMEQVAIELLLINVTCAVAAVDVIHIHLPQHVLEGHDILPRSHLHDLPFGHEVYIRGVADQCVSESDLAVCRGAGHVVAQPKVEEHLDTGHPYWGPRAFEGLNALRILWIIGRLNENHYVHIRGKGIVFYHYVPLYGGIHVNKEMFVPASIPPNSSVW